jgi:dipeptidyl aminopeptidase/acylaminoacyl peptidase
VDRFVPVQVSHANANLPALPLGRTEVIRWKSADGLEIEGLLTYPSIYEPGRRYPLLLVIHGGPTGVFKQSFDASPGLYPVAAFSARGYAVLRPNPRGSSGYGKAFRIANAKDWGGMDYQDLMSGVDHVIGIGVADADRLGVMGWSYGGYITAWAITRTQRFKAASVGGGVSDLVSTSGTTDFLCWIPEYWGAEHWQGASLYRVRSPISHIGTVSTPTFILHGENDVRVPISQGYELYNALKRRGVPVTMVTYPRMPHGPPEPKQRLDIATRNLEWFDRYLRVNTQTEPR